jgi:hypothetical protein
MDKPNCYKCKHRGTLPGSAHSKCNHPEVASGTSNPIMNVLAAFASVGRTPPMQLEALNVKGDPHGIKNGWFNWPWNFDPAWLVSCDGFEGKDDDESSQH